MERINALQNSHRDGDGDIERVYEFLGISSDDWTMDDGFDSAQSRATELREQALASIEDDPWLREMSKRHWPFDDHDEDE